MEKGTILEMGNGLGGGHVVRGGYPFLAAYAMALQFPRAKIIELLKCAKGKIPSHWLNVMEDYEFAELGEDELTDCSSDEEDEEDLDSIDSGADAHAVLAAGCRTKDKEKATVIAKMLARVSRCKTNIPTINTHYDGQYGLENFIAMIKLHSEDSDSVAMYGTESLALLACDGRTRLDLIEIGAYELSQYLLYSRGTKGSELAHWAGELWRILYPCSHH